MNIINIIKLKFSTGIGRDIIWTLIGQVSAMLILLVVNKILSNYLTIDEYGKFNIVKRSTSVLSFVLLGGMGITLPRYLSIYIVKAQPRNTQSVLLSSCVYILLVFLSISLLYLFLYNRLASLVVGSYDFKFYIVCLLYSLSLALISYMAAYYRGIGKFRKFNISQILFQSLMLIPLLLEIRNLYFILLFWTIANFIAIVCFFMLEIIKFKYIVRHFRPEFQHIKRIFFKVVFYSLPRLCGDFFLFAYSAFPVIYVGNKLGLEYASYYSVGLSLVTMFAPVFSFLGVILLPLVSKQLSSNNAKLAESVVSKLTIFYLLLAVVFTIIMYFGMKYMILMFFAEKYMPALEFAKIISISLLPQSMYLLYRNPNDAVSTVPYNTIILAVCFVLLICGFYYFHKLLQFAYVYLVVACIQCFLSILVWKILIYRKIKAEKYNK